MIQLLPSSSQDKILAARERCASIYQSAPGDVRVILSPYRICPLGAHVDHQLGPVSSIAIEHGITIGFVTNHCAEIIVSSTGYQDELRISLHQSLERQYDWGDYARGALSAIAARYDIRTGVSMVVDGRLSEAGISSSAAVGLGYLMAIALANDIQLGDEELISLDREIENDFLGLKNGVLDQSAIVFGKSRQLTMIDCNTNSHRHIPQEEAFTFLAIYSGVREALVGSNKFNSRVDECLEAGAKLASIVTGKSFTQAPLGLTSFDDWQKHKKFLDSRQQRRAEHFFSESTRVHEGARAWAKSDHHEYGRLMTESCRSSINNYETGSKELIRLFEMMIAIEGVYGARFSGAGFRGCAVALVNPAAIDGIIQRLGDEYLREFPEYQDKMWALQSQAKDGLRSL